MTHAHRIQPDRTCVADLLEHRASIVGLVSRRTLSLEQILVAAIELLDAEGLEGLHMRELGERLGSAATAVYWHVKSKSRLIALAGDEVWNEIRLPDVEKVGWRAAAAAMASDLHAMLMRHPWLVQAFGSYVIFGPGTARHHDHSLVVYEAAGFAPGDADRASTAVFTFVLGSALGHAAAVAMRRNTDKATLDETMSEARKVASRFPRLLARIDSPEANYAASPEATFELGLAAILDGLEAQIANRPPRRRGR